MQGENEKQRVRAGERNLPRSESKEQYGFRIASKVIEVEWKDVLHFLAIWVLHISWRTEGIPPIYGMDV